VRLSGLAVFLVSSVVSPVAPSPTPTYYMGACVHSQSPFPMMAVDQLFHDVFRFHPSRARSELRDLSLSDEGGSNEAAAGNQQPLPPFSSAITTNLMCEKK
jgi:hypothetical protein